MSGVLLESRPYRPFKSSEEYLYAMKEDLAEWLQTLYPHLRINVENFMDRLETGVALCEHANAVKVQAAEYVQKKQARMQQLMTRSVTGNLAQAQAVISIPDVKFFSTAKAGTFFARDNVCNFIQWCRQCLQIIECLLFESDDLIMRKNEKHVILCLLEVARKGAKFGMLAPMLVQMERQIDREIAADQRKQGVMFSEGESQDGDMDDDTDSEMEDEQPVLMYGPLPQIVTNDLKSLDEMVRDLVEKCTCPTQFPMIRVSEGKYRIGDTKVLIFVRILRNHVMVRVGGGWDTLSHYLDKHDPCRCRSQHRTTQSAKLVNKPGATDLAGARVYYDRSPPRTPNSGPHSLDSVGLPKKEFLGPPMNSLNRSRSRSPSYASYTDSRRSASPSLPRKSFLQPPNRSRSPTPNFTSTHVTKLTKSPQKLVNQGPQSLPYIPIYQSSPKPPAKNQHVSSIQIPVDSKVTMKSEAVLQVSDNSTDHSDNASEVSDEGYRSLGLVINDKNKNRTSVYSQNSTEDAEDHERQDSIDLEDETNDVGLRKTAYSQKIYGDSIDSPKIPKPQVEKRPSRSNSIEKKHNRSNSIDRAQLETFYQSKTNSKIPSSTIQSKRSSSVSAASRPTSINNTWNGRQRASRPGFNSDTFSPPTMTRNSATRRSVSANNSNYDSNGRRVTQSANTSPTKTTNLRQEILNAVKNAEDDDRHMLEKVQKLLKQYTSLVSLDNNDDGTTGFIPKLREDEKRVHRSPRKDTRSDMASRIPAPIAHKI